MNKFIFCVMFAVTVAVWAVAVMLMWVVFPIIFQHFLIGIMLYGLIGIVIYNAYNMTVAIFEIYKEEF